MHRERQNLGKVNRRLEKKIKECAGQTDEERARAEQFKDQVCHYSHEFSNVLSGAFNKT